MPSGNSYLLVYNLLQFIGWTVILGLSIQHIIQVKTWNLWTGNIKYLIEIFQTLAVLEILHCAVGLVKSSAVTTATQVYSRVFLVWGVCNFVPQIHGNTRGVGFMVIAWCLAEMVRYLYYAFNLLGSVPYILLWLRYTLFIFLYPLGVSGELLCIYTAIPYVRKTSAVDFPLPNKLNFSFHYYILLVLTMLSYIPFFPQLYSYMLVQRKRFLSPAKPKQT